MQRREFLKKSSLAGGLLIINPKFNSFYFNEFSEDELIGKGKPTLFGDGFNLRKEAQIQFDLMRKSAKEKGFTIYSVSSYRSYAHQNSIWERKYKSYRNQGLSHQKTIEKIIEYSTIPGTSRHHWGTDLDIIETTKEFRTIHSDEPHYIKDEKRKNLSYGRMENQKN